MFLNHTKPPFGDINVRKALNYATDKEAINAAVYGGVGRGREHMIPKGRFTAPPTQIPAYPYDLEQAQQLMAESSVPDGFDRHLPVSRPGR